MGIVEDFHAAVGANDNEDARKSNGLRAFQGLPAYPSVIALAGPAGSGKSTAARHLIERHGYTLVKFAGPLKDMCRAIGLTEAEIEGDQKEGVSRMLQGKSPRQFMQLLGTEFGRNLIGPDLWTFLWEDRALRILDQGGRVVVDDLRFANEEQAARQLGGMVIQLDGRGGIAGGHVSEAYRPRADATVWNGDGADLPGALDIALEAWSDAREAA